MERYTRKSIYNTIKEYDVLAKDHEYIEITEWHNGEGFDVNISSYENKQFSLTWGEFKAIKKLIKKLYKE